MIENDHTLITFDGLEYLVSMHGIGAGGCRITVWREVERYGDGGTYMHHADRLYIRVGTDPIRALYHSLPFGAERSDQVKYAYQARFRLAQKVIAQVYHLPERITNLEEAARIPGVAYYHDGEFSWGAVPVKRALI